MASESGLWDQEDFFRLKLRELKAKVPCQQINHDVNSECNEKCRRTTSEIMKTHIRTLWSFLQGERPARDISISFESDEYKQIETVKLNVPWCIFCGAKRKKDDTISCSKCCSSYHKPCRDADQPKAGLSNPVCSHCNAGCRVKSGDVVWHKMKNSIWWPAQILSVGERPDCLSVKPTGIHQAVKFYGDQPGQYCWADPRHLCTFNPDHYLGTATGGNKQLLNAYRLAVEACTKKLP